MKTEIESATKFLVELMKTGSPSCVKLSEEQFSKFRVIVVECLTNYYADHWFPEHPVKGSGYRCIRMNGKVDPILARAGHIMGLAAQLIHSMFPAEFTMWVDPHEVSYRIGENGSICVLYENENMVCRSPPTPPSTPPNKKIRASPEPPFTPMKMQPLFHQQLTPPQALSYHHFSSPSNNNRRASPHHQYQLLQQHQLALLKEANNSNNCKDALRPNHILPLERLFVSS
ncbi:Anti-proliferative protein [Trinorchestia longiramus]|nr:Anti-proliferative protein [Trinorchestia longiramus]